MQDDVRVWQVEECIGHELLEAGWVWALAKVSWVLEQPGLQDGAQSAEGRWAGESGTQPLPLPWAPCHGA